MSGIFPKTILVIGASRGIGFEWARQYSKEPKVENLLLTCRKKNEQLIDLANSNSKVKIIENIEVGDNESIEILEKAVEKLASIDLVVHNSGIIRRHWLGSFTFDEIQEQFNVNSLGPLRVIRAILPRLLNSQNSTQNSSKIAIISSDLGSIEHAETIYPGYYGYKMSKAAVNMMGKTLAFDLKEKNVLVALFHPGFVSTDMTSYKGDITTEESVSGCRKIVEEELNVENSGSFWSWDGRILPW